MEKSLQDFKKTYEAQVKKQMSICNHRKEFVDAGFDSYEKFIDYDGENEVQRALRNKVFHEEQVDTFWELQERGRLIQFYEMKEVSLETYSQRANEQQKARFDVIGERGFYQVYPEVAIENFKRFILYVAITIIFSVVLVVSPVFLKDRSKQLLELQYTARKGRNLYKTKSLAGLISTFLVISTLLIVYFSFYSLNNTSMYFKVPLNIFIGNYSWYDTTFFQYIVLNIVAIYVLGFVFAFLAMSFSNIVPNYIALIGIQIPFVIAMISYGLHKILTGMISMRVPKWIAPASYSLMIIVSILIVVLLWKRENKRDIMNE